MTKFKHLTLGILAIAMVVLVGSTEGVANENPCDTVPEADVQTFGFVHPEDDEDS